MIPAPIVITSFKHASNNIAVTTTLAARHLAEWQVLVGDVWSTMLRAPDGRQGTIRKEDGKAMRTTCIMIA
eukprot:4151990-Amphidinium_carterae.1